VSEYGGTPKAPKASGICAWWVGGTSGPGPWSSRPKSSASSLPLERRIIFVLRPRFRDMHSARSGPQANREGGEGLVEGSRVPPAPVSAFLPILPLGSNLCPLGIVARSWHQKPSKQGPVLVNFVPTGLVWNQTRHLQREARWTPTPTARLLALATIAGTSSATACRFLGGRL